MIIKSGSWSNFLLKMSSRQSLASLRYICMLGSLSSDDDDDPRTTEIRGQGSRCPNPSEIGHFTLLFCRGRLQIVQRFITHVHNHCSACFTTVLLASSWRFAKAPNGYKGSKKTFFILTNLENLNLGQLSTEKDHDFVFSIKHCG